MSSASLHARTPSEARLFNLGWKDLQERRSGTSGTSRCSSSGSPSQSPHEYDSDSEEDQERDFPMLTPSIIEEEEDAFARAAAKALQQLQSGGVVPAGGAPRAILRPSLHSQSLLGPDYSLDFVHKRHDVDWCSQQHLPQASSPYTNASASDGGYWSPASLSSFGSSSSGGSYSSISSREGEDGVDDYIFSKSCSAEATTPSSVSSLAARRGRPMRIKLPPRPNSFGSISPPAAERPEATRNFDSLHRPVGVSGLTNNFSGISLRCDKNEFESDLDRPLRFKSRSPSKHGFAF
ncbi:BZ3500_MvSof-1268-A1-R1_Chr4-2g06935 [Microbotryum saponariae]|uniref:BZ3500_MvSof-1268-A1-R1_Chr4-2g06935 protein n=1 Tax=Microbotryum saponariae TaxID=289078 RepID=A0A2X0MRQ3_9BASI|nr:BZ3500_MvSof-1268-A1-R1_Chr4-2g06935 [Microbotryum saponariae]SDA06600.1 BZ3501_MvSof-1269-A2-R1_Chr4-2g06646 [Microbotryum saponariae]